MLVSRSRMLGSAIRRLAKQVADPNQQRQIQHLASKAVTAQPADLLLHPTATKALLCQQWPASFKLFTSTVRPDSW